MGRQRDVAGDGWSAFAGTFPAGYYVLLPAFYLPVMFMLFALILRGIAFAFRLQTERLPLGLGSRLRRRVHCSRHSAKASSSVVSSMAFQCSNGMFSGGPARFLQPAGPALRRGSRRWLCPARRRLAHLEDGGADPGLRARSGARGSDPDGRHDAAGQRVERLERAGGRSTLVHLAECRLTWLRCP